MEPTDLGVDLTLYVHAAGAVIGTYYAFALPLVFALLALTLGWPIVKQLLFTWLRREATEIAVARLSRKSKK